MMRESGCPGDQYDYRQTNGSRLGSRHEMQDERPYGKDDASYQAAGQEEGIRCLVGNFFDRMEADPRFTTIFELHPDDNEISRDKLARFLCGWLGGPKLYREKYGSISIPRDHEHLPIGHDEKGQWLTCMKESVDEQPFADNFKLYLIDALHVPAEGVRRRRENLISGKAEKS